MSSCLDYKLTRRAMLGRTTAAGAATFLGFQVRDLVAYAGTASDFSRKIMVPPMPSSFFTTTSRFASMKAWMRAMSEATSVCGDSSG